VRGSRSAVPPLSRARFLAATAAVALPIRARAQALERLRIGGVPTDDMTPIFYAIRTGIYRKEGLEVEVVATTSGSASTAAVVGGAYELAKSSPMSALVANQRGLPLVVIGNGAIWDQQSHWNGIVVAPDSPIRHGADCNGKIASAPALNDTAHYGLLAWIEKGGGDAKTLKWVEVPGSAAAAAIGGHRIDIGTLNEPQLTVATDAGTLHSLGPAHNAVGDRWASAVYVARPDWARSHADLVRRWVRATYEAAVYTNAHDAETVDLMAEVTKIPAALLRKVARIHGCTASDPALLQPVVELAMRYKALPPTYNVKNAYFTA
jgi:NitT/TauT family transport system substrate-binding protein